MENQNTNNRGVFPGSNPNAQSSGSSAPGAQNTQSNHNGQQNTLTENLVNEFTQQTIQSNPSVKNTSPSNNNDDVNTYIRLETKNNDGQVSGILEIDLISFRERGVESRFLQVNSVGASQNGQEGDVTIAIDNEADFNKFKEFISNLNWND